MPWATGRGSREGIFCGTKGGADELLRPVSPRGERRDLTTEMVRDKARDTIRKNVSTENPVPRLQRYVSLERMSVDRNKRQQPEDSDSQDESRADQDRWQLVKKPSKPSKEESNPQQNIQAPNKENTKDDYPHPPKEDQSNEPSCPPTTTTPKIMVPYPEGFESSLHLAEAIE